VTLLFIASTVAIAQVTVTKGIKVGLNFASIGGEGSGGTSSTTQYCAGVFFEIQLAGVIAIEPEVLYSVKGFSISSALLVPGASVTQTLSYIDIPVLLKINLPTPGVSFGFYAGPSIGLLVGAKLKGEAPGVPTAEVDNKDVWASTDAGLVIGTGIKIPLGLASLTLDARYNMGLSQIDKDGLSKSYNRVFSIMAGIGF
jgi:hypothetical protein